ncbi:DNA repair protein REV1 [Sesamum angolense]|uniref:DNA repair protein REV1 n=1 Tax=Sesamum angolense TaxID=2727404 RepID=A0AAE1X4N0_9LAMI|nr:DNA repair protein REV1 [Sesamum angolense]
MSFNSDSKSKRSFKSISSNPSSSSNYSSDGRNSNKKKKTAQKSLGMAWGSNSRSSSRSTFRNSPFSDFGSYMVVKNQKLHEQFDAAASSSSHSGSSSGNSIFCGVSIFVDGYTVPSSQDSFFVSVVVRNRTEFLDKPVAVCHSDNPRGVKAGMFVKDAKILCPQLVIVPYDFEAYEKESKSIGAEVNWGVRFRNLNDTRHFLINLCKEVALRLHGCGLQGRSFTLKIKKKRSDAGEPVKYMGCGDCENLSHTITIPMATDHVDVLQRLANQLFGYFRIAFSGNQHVSCEGAYRACALLMCSFAKYFVFFGCVYLDVLDDVKDIRGMGLQVSKLEGAEDSKLVHKRNTILPWLTSTKARDQNQVHDPPNHGGATGEKTLSDCKPPPLQDLDVAVIESLPPEVVSEINDMYGGRLLCFISKHKSKTVDTTFAALPKSEVVEGTQALQAHHVEPDTIAAATEEMQCCEEAPASVAVSASFSSRNLMPSSLSQVDCSVLQQLPDELRKDIIELLPPHRESEFVQGASSNVVDEQNEFAASDLSDLWIGSPPKWVEKFRISPCSILNNFAEMYRPVCGDGLSSLLQRIISGLILQIEVATTNLMMLLTVRSELFLQVYNDILPYLQVKLAPCIPLLHYSPTPPHPTHPQKEKGKKRANLMAMVLFQIFRTSLSFYFSGKVFLLPVCTLSEIWLCSPFALPYRHWNEQHNDIPGVLRVTLLVITCLYHQEFTPIS